jgi:DedD protein
MQLTRLSVYAVAFALGLSLALLFRYTARPSPPSAASWELPAPAPLTRGSARLATGARHGTTPVSEPVSAPPPPAQPTTRPDAGRQAATPPSRTIVQRSNPGRRPQAAAPPRSASVQTPAAGVTAKPPLRQPAPAPQTPAGAAAQSNAAQPDGSQGSSVVVTPVPDTPPAAEGGRGAVWATPRFHVQVGAFSSQADADALVRRLQSLGYIATVAGGNGYRVWVGGYFDRETAERLADNLRKLGFNPELQP